MTVPRPREILEAVRQDRLTVEEALAALRAADLEELGFAALDHQRARRKGFAEVVYCEGKTPEQCGAIIERLAARGDTNVLGTRADARIFAAVRERVADASFDELARTVSVLRGAQKATGCVTVVAAGTSDLPVAQEAAVTAELMGSHVERIADVGVAGLHRLLRALPRIEKARVVVAVAGMEGALASVLAGLIRAPVIAVPTSVGYGTHLGGVTPLLAMLNSCAPGLAVVNVDNGFGAGYMAHLINQTGEPQNGETRTELRQTDGGDLP